jgi:hypothetical protein
MTRPDIDAIISRLRAHDNPCLLPEVCQSRYCVDWKALEAYIHELEEFSDNIWIALLEIRNQAKELVDGISRASKPALYADARPTKQSLTK